MASAFCILFTIYSLYIPYICSQSGRSKSVSIKPSTIASLISDGITITTSESSVSTPTNIDKWRINTTNQHGADFVISTDKNWGFDSTLSSTLQLFIKGSTANSTFRSAAGDGEIIFIFGVDDQYFAEIISLNKDKSTVYKECPSSFSSLINRNMDIMINAAAPNRYYRICGNAINSPNSEAADYWQNVGSKYKEAALWPMFISITNDPVSNKIFYSWTDSMNGFNKIISQFDGSFSAKQGIKIYIAGNKMGTQFEIDSIDLTYQYTFNPTLIPTVIPTLSPSANPTLLPTVSPMIMSLSATTMKPTKFPSIASNDPIIYYRLRTTEKSEETVLNESSMNYDMITWLHACLIVAVIFIFFAGWIGIFVFVYSNKRKKAKKRVQKVNDRLTVIQNDDYDDRQKEREYHSRSAFAVDEMTSQDIENAAQFLNICKEIDLFEGSSRRTTSTLPIISLMMDNDPSIVGTDDDDDDDEETSVDSDTSFEQIYGPGHEDRKHIKAIRKITDYTHSIDI